MAVNWTRKQREQIDRRLAAHPLDEHHWCTALSRELLPIAREHDVGARGLVIRPACAQTRYAAIRSRNRVVPYWFHHVTVEVDDHCVDALTGADGTARSVYLTMHFENDPADLAVDETDPNLEDPCL